MKITLLFLILSLVVLASGKTRWFQLSGYSFEKYLQEYNKHYASTEEYNFRKQIFEQRLIEINSHNQDSTKSWKKGVNHMSDWTTEEQRRLLGYRKMPRLQQSKTVPQKKTTDLPKSIDWRDKNIISAVKDQGQCGSCWTFGTAETVESYWAISTGQLTDLSEQQILDCTPNPDDCGGFGGCQGGTPEIAYAQIISRGGLATEWTYPYASYYGHNQSCSFNNPSPAFAKLSGYEVLPSNDYNAVVQHLSSTGPLAINVDASVWFEYESGIFTGCNQTNVDIDHVVQLVGYGNSEGQDYWLIRNSWSPAWGEDGYIRLPKEENPTCGTDYHPQDGTGCNGGPAQVTVCGACGILYDTSYPIISQ